MTWSMELTMLRYLTSNELFRPKNYTLTKWMLRPEGGSNPGLQHATRWY